MTTRLSTLVLLTLLTCGLHAAWAQDNPAQALKPMARDVDPDFEVATIKPALPDDHNQGFRLKGRRISIESNSLSNIICFAYSMQKSQIINAPKWFEEQQWDIDGVPDVDGAPNWPQYRRMLQKLVAARFGVKLHRDQRELSVYTLTVANGGPKLDKSKSDPDEPSDQSGHGIGSQQFMKFTNDTMTDFAETMELMVDRPVVDKTGLEGHYDFTLLWTPDVMRAAEPDPAPALFTAVREQLGLRLQATRAMTDVLVIDAATQPTQN